jgi:hypothetical protein
MAASAAKIAGKSFNLIFLFPYLRQARIVSGLGA